MVSVNKQLEIVLTNAQIGTLKRILNNCLDSQLNDLPINLDVPDVNFIRALLTAVAED